MKNYVITATNNLTNDVEHVATSDAPLDINPFEGMADTHTFGNLEFDNLEGSKLVRARDFLNSIDKRTRTILPEKASATFSNMRILK